MTDGRVARRYAQALFSAALAGNNVRAVESDLEAVAGAIERDKAFRDYVSAPYASREEKEALFTRVFGDRVTGLTMQAIRMMLDKRREGEIPGIYHRFVEIRREHDGIVYATVTSATPLTPDQKDALVKKVQAVIGKTVDPEFKVDPHLLGGVQVAYDNYILDGTARGTLSKLRERLRYELLKQS